jgi:hypothetical protein
MSNVVPLRPGSLPGIGVASTASEGTLLRGSRNEVWQCAAYDSNGRGRILFVKPALGLRGILVEILSAQVGQCMGLPCPMPFVVTANPTHLGRPAGKKILAFGSELVGRLAFPINDTDMLLRELDRQKITDTLFCFDEFIANSVRGPRDIVFDPTAGAVIIDHEGAMEATTAPSDTVTNWIADRVLERTEQKQRPLLLKRLRAKVATLHEVEMGPIPSAVQFDQGGVGAYAELLQFLQARLGELDRLLSQRILPQQSYVNPIEDTDETGRTTGV